jgi:non-homologous end joining protein Ku
MLKWLKRKILIYRVNKTLNIKLRKDQIDYIFFDKPYTLQGRRNGKTLAYILKILLNDGIYHIVDIEPDENRLNIEYRQFFRRWFRETYLRLSDRGLVKCVIYGF